MQEFLAPGELDPLNRRLSSEKKPDVVVQVVILAEDTDIQEKLRQADIHCNTIQEVQPIEVQPARVLSHLYAYLGVHLFCNNLIFLWPFNLIVLNLQVEIVSLVCPAESRGMLEFFAQANCTR